MTLFKRHLLVTARCGMGWGVDRLHSVIAVGEVGPYWITKIASEGKKRSPNIGYTLTHKRIGYRWGWFVSPEEAAIGWDMMLRDAPEAAAWLEAYDAPGPLEDIAIPTIPGGGGKVAVMFTWEMAVRRYVFGEHLEGGMHANCAA